MQKTINQILEGNFIYDHSSLDFSCTKIEIELPTFEQFEGSFQITNTDHIKMVGKVTTSDRRMQVVTTDIQGESQMIYYIFHGEQMEDGDVVKGEFHIISNVGEYSLPFVVSKVRRGLESSMGPIKNLFHFANLAKSNWREALRLFYSRDFSSVFTGNDKQYLIVYKGLSVQKGNSQNMDEFLQEINKKKAIEIQIDNKEIHIAQNEKTRSGFLEILFEGWGYVDLDIRTEGEFLNIETNRVQGDEFPDHRFFLRYQIDDYRLHSGCNHGKIIVRNRLQELEVTVLVDREEIVDPKHQEYLERKKGILQLMQLYMDVKQKKIANQYWKKESLAILDQMMNGPQEDYLLMLFKAQIFITQDKNNEAQWLLSQAGDYLDSNHEKYADKGIMEAYLLYLSTLLRDEEDYVKKVEERLRELFGQYGEDWRIGWLRLYVEKDFKTNPASRYMFLEKQLLNGCTSPVIYMEMLNLLKLNPTVIRKLTLPILRVLYYGARQEELTPELVERIVYMAQSCREGGELLLRLLILCYEQENSDEVLKWICVLLINRGLVSKKSRFWYEKGIVQGIRINNLYEYYMDTLDLSENNTIPKEVFLFFSYQNTMDYKKTAYLYSYLLAHRNEMTDIYENNRDRMTRFVLEQVARMRIDRNLAYLYREFLTDAVIDEQNANALSQLIFSNQVTVEQPGIIRVVVCHENYERELEASLSGGVAWIPIFGNEYKLFLEDKVGNRYCHSLEYRLEKLLLPGKYIQKVAANVTNQPLIDLYCVENTALSADQEKHEGQYKIWKRLYECPDISEQIRNKMCLNLLQYLNETDRTRELDELLCSLSTATMTNQQRLEVLRYLVIREKIDLAYDLICKYPIADINAKILVRLIGKKIYEKEFVYDDILLDYCKKLFNNGKYDGVILRYLCMHYYGKVKVMRNIWKAARAFDENCFELSERILVQMLSTGAYIGEKNEIFEYYLAKGGKLDIIKAYFAQNSYDYFVKERIVSPVVFREIGRLARNGEKLHKVCKLAFIKFYSEFEEEPDEGQKKVLSIYLKEMIEKNIHLNGFKTLSKYCEAQAFSDKTILEYHAKPDSRVMIHYLHQKRNEEDGEYLVEEMRPVYGGVYFAEFVLFFGETIQYYITEQNGEREELTESGTLQKTDMEMKDCEDNFSRINDLVISSTLRDYTGLEQLLEEYYKLQYLAGRYFELR